MITEEKEIAESAWFGGEDDKKYFNESLAVSQLLLANELFIGANDSKEEKTAMLFVLCNDLFYWASADAEPISTDEIEDFYKCWIDNKKWGTQKWCCRKRNLRPQVPIVITMKEDGAWDEAMESLPSPSPS